MPFRGFVKIVVLRDLNKTSVESLLNASSDLLMAIATSLLEQLRADIRTEQIDCNRCPGVKQRQRRRCAAYQVPVPHGLLPGSSASRADLEPVEGGREHLL